MRRFRKLLSRLPKLDALEAIWVLDRGKRDPTFQKPAAYTYPLEYLFAKIGEPGAIFSWELETIVLELLACRVSDGPRVLNAKSWLCIAEIVNALRAVENDEGHFLTADNIMKDLFRTMHRQTPWQIHDWNAADAIRWWSMFQSDFLRSLFEDRVGLSLQKFIRIGITWNVLLNERPLSPLPTGSAIGVTAQEMLGFARAISQPFERACEAAREMSLSTTGIAYRRSILREKPLISIGQDGNGPFIRPFEQLVIWRLTSGLYYDVVGDSRASSEIGLQFENYVRRLVRAYAVGLGVKGDIEYGTKQNPRRSVDCIVHNGESVELIIECKAKKFPLVAKNSIEETNDGLRAIGEIAKGIVQLCMTEQALINRHIQYLRIAAKRILILITLDDWVFTGLAIRNELYAKAEEFAGTQRTKISRIEKREVVLCTATEFEELISTYDYGDFKRICERNIEDRYKDYALTSVAHECFAKERRKARYPLKGELDQLLGHRPGDLRP